MNITVRPIEPKDYKLLEDFLYYAIFIPPGGEVPPRDIIFNPEIFIYIKDFGAENDIGVVAELNGEIVGIAWARIIPAYGNIDDKTPELAISIRPEYRSKGIGSAIMDCLFIQLNSRGFKRTSLSVQKDNPAVKFYKRLGYQIKEDKLDRALHEDYIMVKNLT